MIMNILWDVLDNEKNLLLLKRIQRHVLIEKVYVPSAYLTFRDVLIHCVIQAEFFGSWF